MTAKEIERFRRAEALFDGTLQYPAGPRRDAFLERETDAGLLAEVRELLANDDRVTHSIPPEALPAFGAWQAVSLLGRGGMGVVYLAERADGAFKMKAAVKVVPLALASLDIEERFRRERQFLASLDHPKIARLIDGGLTSAGLPYLVMEYVEGLPIDRYCDTARLDTRARIGLMRQVLEALIYVHSRQVIHRDLKSSNILVDAAGTAKLLDFGTARLVDAGGDNAITRSGVFAFTPEYASPEQAQGSSVTYASDVYSAGVLLYRLLTGRPPYRLPDDPTAIVQTIAHTDPEPSGLDRPLDAILRKALRKNADERYPSADEMDADLARYLSGQEVEARRPRKPGWIATAALLFGICALAGWLFLGRKAATVPPSIAVLPFTGGGYLGSGLTHEVNDALARLKTLRVVGQGSAQQVVAELKGKPLDAREAGKELNVTHLLTGSMEQAGDRIEVAVALINASNGARVWSATYNRPIADLSMIEGELEAAILAGLGIPPTARATRRVPNQQAHSLFLKARFEWNQLTPDGNASAQQDYRRALQLDPDYADAWAGLGGAIWNRDPSLKDPAAIKMAADCYRKAIRLDPDNLWAHAGAATYAMYFDWDWKRAEREFKLASEDGRSAGGEIGLAFLYQITGRRKEANEHAARALDLDPISSVGILNQAQFLNRDGRVAESCAEWRKFALLFPGNSASQPALARCDAVQGKAAEVVERLRKIPDRAFLVNVALSDAEALAGHSDESLRIIRSLEAGNRDGHIPMIWFAQMYANIGDLTSTVNYLDRAINQHEPAAIYIHVHPDFAKWQNTPEFHRLKSRMGLDW